MAAKPAPRKRADGSIVWRVQFRLTPGGKPTAETFATSGDAAAFARLVDRVGGKAAREARDASTVSPLHMPTLGTWLETHLTALAAARTPGTIADYRRMAARTWLPTLGPLPLDQINRAHIVAWVSAQRVAPARGGGTYAPKSIANSHGLLSSTLAAAVDASLIPGNVARGVALPSDALSAEMTILTRGEFEAVLDEIPPHYRPLVVTLAGTGMRWGEATALTVADVDLGTDMLRVVRAWKKGATGVYIGTPKSRRSRRTIKMGGAVRAVVAPLLASKAPDALVFTAAQDGRVRAQNFRERVWHPAVLRSGIGRRVRVHDLRHTHASWLLGAGVAPQVVQMRLGHESLDVTSKTYGHLLPDAQVAAALAADAAMAWVPQIGP